MIVKSIFEKYVIRIHVDSKIIQAITGYEELTSTTLSRHLIFLAP